MILFVIFLNLFAQNVVIQAEETTNFDYQTYLSNNPAYMSYIQYTENRPNHLSLRILEDLKKAQFEFLNGSLSKAEQHFKKIVELRHKANWRRKERKAIHFSLLRLAQLTKEASSQNKYLATAAVFAPSTPIDTNIFPPPLVNKYKMILKHKKTQVWPLPTHSEKFDKILVNGKVRRGDTSFIELPNDLHRIQFLSNRYMPVHYTVKAQDLETLKLPHTPLATGPCQAPSFNPALNTKVDFHFKKMDCVGKRNAFSKPIESYSNKLGSALTTTNNKSIFKSKWFWIGVSALATGALIAHQQNQRRESAPAYPTSNPTPQPEVQVFTNE